jgi:hypothetical protein
VGAIERLPTHCDWRRKSTVAEFLSASCPARSSVEKDSSFGLTDAGKYGEPPERILEIATDINLRDTYKLKDGDVIEVEVSENRV